MIRFRRITVLLMLFAIVPFSGCSDLMRKDRSLTADEYKKLGMPDPGHPWTQEELTKAHAIIGSIRTKTFIQLPEQGSRRSGVLFERLISADNLSFLDDTSMTLRDKAFRIQALGAYLNDLARMYTNTLSSRQYFSREITAIHLFELEVRERMLELAGQIDNSADPMDRGMKEGRIGIVNAYVSLLSSLIRIQEKENIYSRSQLRSMSRAVSASIVKNSKYLDPGNRLKLINELKTVSDKVHTRYFKRDFKDLLKEPILN